MAKRAVKNPQKQKYLLFNEKASILDKTKWIKISDTESVDLCWYGAFEPLTDGNPFDCHAIQVKIRLIYPDGKEVRTIVYRGDDTYRERDFDNYEDAKIVYNSIVDYTTEEDMHFMFSDEYLEWYKKQNEIKK